MRTAVTISDKFWKQKQKELQALLQQPGGSLANVRHQLTHDVSDFFTALQDELLEQVKQVKAKTSITARVEGILEKIAAVVESLWVLRKTLTEFRPPMLPYDEIMLELAQEILDLVKARLAASKLGMCLKVVYRVDPKALQALARKIADKLQPEELAAWHPAMNGDDRAAMVRHWTSVEWKFPELARKLLKQEKTLGEVEKFLPFLRSTLEANYSQEALQAADDLTSFDLYGMKVVVDVASFPDPKWIKVYVKYLNECYQRMRQKGLTKAWYGEVFFECHRCGGENVGAHYHRTEDLVRFFDVQPGPWIAKTMAHELGHRYWFKQMSQEQRIKYEFLVNAPNWDVGKFRENPDPVKPVSDYGHTNIAEAFAEAFAHFVMGKDMSRAQIDSFKTVLNPGVRTSTWRDGR